MSNKRAEALVAEGEKCLKKFFGSKKDKAYDAAEKFAQAANLYKIDRNFAKSGDCYFAAASCLKDAGDLNSASSHAQNAVFMYFKAPDGVEQATKALNMSNDILCELNQPAKSAQLIMKQADLLEKEGAADLAYQALDRALKVIEGAQQVDTLEAQIYEHQAYLLCDKEKYKDAADKFMQVAMIRNRVALTQTSAQNTFIIAELARLAAGDIQGALNEYPKICNECPSITVNFEGRFLNEIIDAVRNDTSKLPKAVKSYKECHERAKWLDDILERLMHFDELKML